MKESSKSLDQRVDRLIRDMRVIRKAQERLVFLVEEKKRLKRSLANLEKRIKTQVKRLPPVTKAPLKLLQSFLKTVDNDALEVQKEQYLRMAMKYNEMTKMLNLIDYEEGLLLDKVDNEKLVAQNLEELMQHRAEAFNVSTHQEIAVLMEQIDHQSRLRIEIVEAIAAAVRVQRALRKTEKLQTLRLKTLKSVDVENVLLFDLNLKELRAYQELAVEVKRRYVMLEYEINDVLNFFKFVDMNHHRYSEFFLEEFQQVLLDDIIKSDSDTENTRAYVQNHLIHIKRILETLRKDRDAIRRQIAKLTKKRDKLILAS